MIANWQHLIAELPADRDRTIDPETCHALALKAEVLLIQTDTTHGIERGAELLPFIDKLTDFITSKCSSTLLTRWLLRVARWSDRTGVWDYAAALYRRAEAAAISQNDVIRRIEALEELGDIYRRQGQFKSAVQSQETARELARSIEHSVLEAHAMNNLGVIAVEQGNLGESRRCFETALTLLGSQPVPVLEGHIYNNLGVVYCIAGKPENAYSELTRALVFREKSNDRKGLAETCHNLGMALMDMERFSDADEYLEKARMTARDICDTPLLANILLSKADLNLRTNMPEIAVRTAAVAMPLHERLNDPLGLADGLRIAGSALLQTGDPAAARDHITRAVALCEKYQYPLGLAQAAEALYRLEKSMGNIDEAQHALNRSVTAYESAGNPDAVRRLKNTQNTTQS